MNIKPIIGRIIICLTLFLSISCTREEKIVIISTNDVHGQIDAFPQLATFVEGVRSADTAVVLLVDAGDRQTGNPYNDLAEKRGLPIIELMNELGYNYATLGNHEFDNGQLILSARIEDSKFSTILANMKVVDAPVAQLPPYLMFDVGNSRIAMFGLITNLENGHPDGKPVCYAGMEFPDPIETAKLYAPLKDSVDLLIGVTHVGFHTDSLLALAMPELGLIIGGHSHTVIPVGKKIGNAVVTQTGGTLRYVGVTTITIKGKQVKSIENHLVKLDAIAPSPKYQQMVDSYKQNPELARAVGSTSADMNRQALANWLTDAIRKKFNADMSFYNGGGIRVNEFKKGNISTADVFAMEPFHSKILMFDMTVQEIKTLLLTKFQTYRGVDLHPSGVSYKIICDENGNGTDVAFTPALKANKKYKVALSDYVSSAYIFSQQGQGTETEPLLTSIMMEDLAKNSPISPSTEVRAEIAK